MFSHTFWEDCNRSANFLMEGEPERLNGNMKREEPVVLWEKCIQQSIIVDLSEDESLHLSDLESSLAFHISQAGSASSEESIRLSGCGEFSDYDSASESTLDSHSERNHSKSSARCRSVQRPNTAVQDVPFQNLQCGDPGQNTSDEDHEDLPYDGDLGSPYFNQTAHSECDPEGTQGSDTPDALRLKSSERSQRQPGPVESTVNALKEVERPAMSQQDNVQPRCLSKDDLIRLGRLIEAETFPEVSLLESMDDTVFSRASQNCRQSHPCYDSVSICETYNSYSKQRSASSLPESVTSARCSKKLNTNSCESDVAVSEHREQRAPLLRTRSFNELKYGQGQVHYPLPDFSKVAPRVKIPKNLSKDPPDPALQSPSRIHEAHSSPEMLDVVSRVLEDSGLAQQRSRVFIGQDQPPSPALVQHLQAQYDKLLVKYADAENLIDQMRLGAYPSSEMKCKSSQDYRAEESSALPPGKVENKAQAGGDEASVFPAEPPVGPSDGEIMTAELSDVVSHFVQNVEGFQANVSHGSMGLEEQQMILRSLMEAQDQLERKYMCKKEEHRVLEMQNYLGICRNTGTFDPDRLVEGSIFRLGMHIEDVKEMIDRNLCERASPPLTSSAPPPLVRPVPAVPAIPPPQPPPEDPRTNVSVDVHGDTLDATGAGAGHVSDAKEQSSETCKTKLSRNAGPDSGCSRSSQTLRKGFLIPSAEEEEEEIRSDESVLSEATRCSNVLAHFCAANDDLGERASPAHSLQERRPQTDKSLSLSAEGSCFCEAFEDCDGGPQTPLITPESQRNVSVETDSGFGSSYLNHSGSGSFQLNINGSFLSQPEPTCSSESEGSCSNVQTTIEPVTLTRAPRAQPSVQLEPPSVAHPVQQWVDSTTQEDPGTVLGTKHHRMSEPTLSKMSARGSPSFSCSCNNEAILALQSEVSQLKKDMNEGLIQLPGLAKKLDYLTTKHKRATNAKTRGHQKIDLNSSINRLTAASPPLTPVKLDWISTDFDPSKSKGADNEDTTASEMQFDHWPIEGSRDSHFVHHDSGLHSPGAHLTGRGFAGRWSPLCSTPIHKPLLQVNYGSSSSLPAGYKLREYPLPPAACSWKRSTQSDSALLPSNVYFQHTMSPFSAPSKLGGRTSGHSGSKEEDIHRALDQALEVARCMKKTTDRMALSLKVDLAAAKRHRQLHRSRKHHL